MRYEIEGNQHFLVIYLQENGEGNLQTHNEIDSLEFMYSLITPTYSMRQCENERKLNYVDIKYIREKALFI